MTCFLLQKYLVDSVKCLLAVDAYVVSIVHQRKHISISILPSRSPPTQRPISSSVAQIGYGCKKDRKLTKLLNDRLQFIQVRLVLPNILHLLLDTLQDPDGSRIIVHLPSSFQSFRNDTGGRDQIVCEAVVESSLEFE